MTVGSFGSLPSAKSLLAWLADRLLGPDAARGAEAAPEAPALGPFRIVGSTPDWMEIEDRHGLRRAVPLTLGARTLIAGVLRRRGLSSPLGLTIRREPFDVDGAIFYRWAVDEPACANSRVSKAEAAAAC